MAVQSIASNIYSVRAQRSLSESISAASKVYERLSSGQRITRSSDDAAGLAIAESLAAQTRVSIAGRRNIDDGISALSIVQASLSSQQELLVRMKELAEQSANGVYSSAQRQALNREYQSLIEEFGRIGMTTSFNSQALLLGTRDGSPAEIAIQAGTDGRASSVISIATLDSSSYSGVIGLTGDYNGTGDINVLDLAIADNMVLNGEVSLDRLHEISRGAVAYARVLDSAGEERELYITMIDYPWGGAGRLLVYTPGEPLRADPGFWGNGLVRVGVTSSADPEEVQTQALDFGGGVTASVTVDFRYVTIQSVAGRSEFEDEYEKYYGPGTAANAAKTQCRVTAINFTGVETVKRARFALDVIANRAEDLSHSQATFGSLMNRLSYAWANLTSFEQGLSSAESRIRDADVADEAAKLVRTQILQEAGAAILGQANQAPALILELLQ